LINIERKVIDEIQRMEKRLEAQLDRAIEGSRVKRSTAQVLLALPVGA
jgi:hypothetical protein